MRLLVNAATAQAGNESWVSGTGADTGNCPRTAPCRTFQFAHDQTSNNGAINVLTSGNFGPLTITKPISIVADEVEAVINTALPSSHNPAAIVINAGGGAVVSLRGLTIDMRGSASNEGISFVAGKALHVQNSVIRKSTLGIRFAAAAGTSELHVADTAVEGGFNEIFVQTTGNAAITAAFDRVRVENGEQNGIIIGATGLAITATLRVSVVAGNGAGVVADTAGAGAVNLMIERTALVNNGTGILAFPGATVRMGNSTLTGNNIATNGSSIFSYGTNKIDGNGTDTTPSIIPLK